MVVKTGTLGARRLGARAEKTRLEILSAAEELFAERGFSDTRLEDVAERVGVRRAALFYYFRDKRALYEAVVEDVFEGLLARVRSALAEHSDSLAHAVEAAVSRWVEYVWERPSTAHILLREAMRRDDHSEAFRALARPALELLGKLFADGRRQGVFRPVTADPFHFASIVGGATVFFVAGMPSLVPDLPFDPLSREQLEAHRRDVLRVTHRLLGLPGLRLVTESP